MEGQRVPTEAMRQAFDGDPMARRAAAALALLRRKRGMLLGQRLKGEPSTSTFTALNVESSLRAPLPHARGLSGRPAAGGEVAVNVAQRPKAADEPASSCDMEKLPSLDHMKVSRQYTGSSDVTRFPDSEPEGRSSSDHSGEDVACPAFLEARKLLLGLRLPGPPGVFVGGPAPAALANFRAQAQSAAAASMSGQVTPMMSRQVTPMLDILPPGRQLSAPMMSRQETPQAYGSGSGYVTPKAPAMPPGDWSRQSTPMSRQVSDFTPRTPKFSRQLSDVDELRRALKSLLNKVCPENIDTIGPKFGSLEIKDAQQLSVVIESIFKKALTEPHYCETYADLIFGLRSVFPEFPAPDGGKHITFKSQVLNVCQNEFEELLNSQEPSVEEQATYEGAELDMCRKQRKNRMLANMKFIGHLYLRQLLSAKVILSVSRELVSCDSEDDVPAEHALECVCELLVNIGYTLESQPAGQEVVKQVCCRLLGLKNNTNADGGPAYCKRVQFMIQDLLETRAAGWSKKSFKSSAKTKGEIRLEQAWDIECKSMGVETPTAEVTIAGQRPTYLTPVM